MLGFDDVRKMPNKTIEILEIRRNAFTRSGHEIIYLINMKCI